ncbi:NAD(P)H-hydrate dehydratase [Microbacterium sp.]|uniref:NAD(P)H-hydrate dehydratase n=1 Tax=Microbacterium sp. TaxID=51671 RepID=UPI0025E55F43|nr:NAD(P)H-hydrate dehydratase [Microbacterium sp.]
MTAGTEWTHADVAALLRAPTDADDKYSRGVVGLLTGSARYPGAAVLGVEAAWRAGAGMVRYLGPARALVLARRPETVTAAGRVQAWVAGSGMDAAHRSSDESAALERILAGEAPVVVDAGALDLVSAATAPLVLTPHDREHAALRARLGMPGNAERAAATRETAARVGGVVLLKGATTIIAGPDGALRTVTSGARWLSTAGTGDVLAGILGALLAGGGDPFACAASAAWLHGRAGAAASRRHGGGPLVALEVAEETASVIGRVLESRRGAEPRP